MFGIFKRRRYNPGSSRVRIWADEQRKLAASKNTPVEVCADAIMWAITRFSDVTPPDGRDNEQVWRLSRNVMNAYSGDSTLFEIGCFLLFQLDVWCHSNNHDKIREDLLPTIVQRFVTMFESIGGIEDAGMLFDQRLDYYGTMLREGEGASMYRDLENLVAYTSDNAPPKVLAGWTKTSGCGVIFGFGA